MSDSNHTFPDNEQDSQRPSYQWQVAFQGFRKDVKEIGSFSNILTLILFFVGPAIGAYMNTQKYIVYGIASAITIAVWWIAIRLVSHISTSTIAVSQPIKDALSTKTDSSESAGFLVFTSKQYFDIWHKEVMFRLGLPKHGRLFATNEVADNYIIKQYANWKRHLDPSDQRVRCGYDNKLPTDMIDNNAQLKYKFIKASYDDLEEMGFIRDRPNIVNEEIFNFDVIDTTESTGYVAPMIGRSWTISPEFNFEFIMCLYKIAGFRNKYIADLGSITNKSRISIYLDKEDYMCFRVIDENSKSHIIRMNHNLFNSKYQLNFKFAKCAEKSYLEIYVNGRPVAQKSFNFSVPFHYNNDNKIFVGANLDGTYCCKMMMFIGRIFVIKENKNIPLFTFDPINIDSTIISDQEIIAREDNGMIMEEKHSN